MNLHILTAKYRPFYKLGNPISLEIANFRSIFLLFHNQTMARLTKKCAIHQ